MKSIGLPALILFSASTGVAQVHRGRGERGRLITRLLRAMSAALATGPRSARRRRAVAAHGGGLAAASAWPPA